MTTALWIFVIFVMAAEGFQNFREKPSLAEVLLPKGSAATRRVLNLLLSGATLCALVYLWKFPT
jgi:hypothetical protein